MHNSLASIAPTVARFWNKDKNANTPEQTVAGSHGRAEWRCPDCKYEWQAPVKQHVNNNSGCPKCSQTTRQAKQKQPTFAAAQHRSLAEWDYELNAKEGPHPHRTALACQFGMSHMPINAVAQVASHAS